MYNANVSIWFDIFLSNLRPKVWQPDIITNAISSEMIKSMQSFGNELCMLLIIADDSPCVTILGCHTFLAFFLELLAKLLHAATFLDTAATYHLCIVVVLKMPMWGATTRLSSYTFCKTLIGMHARSQNLILPIITFRSLPSDCHHRTANKLIVIWRWWLEDLHCDRRELKRCLSGNKVKGLVAIASGILKIQIFVFAWMTLLLTFQFSFTLLALDKNYLIM